MKHPALVAYNDLAIEIFNNHDDPSLMPYAGDPVGRARLEAELSRRGITIPSNIIDEFNWFDEIGLTKLAKQWTRKFKNRARQ